MSARGYCYPQAGLKVAGCWRVACYLSAPSSRGGMLAFYLLASMFQGVTLAFRDTRLFELALATIAWFGLPFLRHGGLHIACLQTFRSSHAAGMCPTRLRWNSGLTVYCQHGLANPDAWFSIARDWLAFQSPSRGALSCHVVTYRAGPMGCQCAVRMAVLCDARGEPMRIPRAVPLWQGLAG